MFCRCGLALNQQELDKIWATLSVANDGMYSYSALIRHFIQFKAKNKIETTLIGTYCRIKTW